MFAESERSCCYLSDRPASPDAEPHVSQVPKQAADLVRQLAQSPPCDKTYSYSLEGGPDDEFRRLDVVITRAEPHEAPAAPPTRGAYGSDSLAQQLQAQIAENMALQMKLSQVENNWRALKEDVAMAASLGSVMRLRLVRLLIRAIYAVFLFASRIRGRFAACGRQAMRYLRHTYTGQRHVFNERHAPPTNTIGADESEAWPSLRAVTFPTLPPEVPQSKFTAEPLFAPMRWRATARAQSDPELIKLAVLAVVHRSGSTLLQRICNARKQTLIWGEHGGAMKHFASIFHSLVHTSFFGQTERTKYFENQENPNLWIANMCPEVEYAEQAIVDSTRGLLNSFYGQYADTHDIVGFKEVRYGRAEMELLRRCYPTGHLLLLVRHPFTTWNSTPRDWFTLDDWTCTWDRNSRAHLELAGTDSHCHLLRYEDLVAREKRTLEVISDLAKVSRAQIEDVLEHKVGSRHAGISDEERQQILDRCREPMKWLGYA